MLFRSGESVEVTSSALLAALEKYPMAVHPLATPGAPYRRNPFNPRLVQVLANAGLIQHVLAADEQPAFTDLHAADTTAGIAQRARALAQVRATLNAPAAHAAVTELVDDWRIPVTKLPPIFRNPEKLSRPPGTGETAIEAPYRLVVSPSTQSGWTHADDPVPDTSGTAVELWHTRLGHRDADGTVTEAEPGRTFGFAVKSSIVPIAHWRYDITQTANGCRVAESTWDNRPGLLKLFAASLTGVADRDAANAENIRLTLERLKARAEAA